MSYKAKEAVVCESLLGDTDPDEEVALQPSDVCRLQYNFESSSYNSRVLLYSEECVPDIKVSSSRS